MRHLIVDDEIGENLAKWLRGRGECVIAKSIAEAERALGASEEPFDAMILDKKLPDGNGFNLLAALRSSGGPHARSAALILTAWREAYEPNVAYDLGALYLEKPFTVAQIRRFVDRASTRGRIDIVAADLAQRHHLTDAETRALVKCAMGLDREAIAEECGVSAITVKKQALAAAQKMGADSPEQAAMRLLREALAL